jgi:hypothetical protein
VAVKCNCTVDLYERTVAQNVSPSGGLKEIRITSKEKSGLMAWRVGTGSTRWENDVTDGKLTFIDDHLHRTNMHKRRKS